MLTVMSLADSTIRVASGMVDSTLMRVAVLLPSAFIQGAKYRIDIPKAAFHDIYNHPNDSINATVTVTKVEDYGNLHFSIDAQTADTVLIVQLLDEKGKVVQSHNAKAGEKVFFQHLTPAKYKVRAIVDADGNGEWTPGDLRRMLSPERVVYYKKTFDVRANWDFEETFVIK